MGNETSSHHAYAANDFELVIRSSKELERFLTEKFSATGNGLGDKIISARHNGSPLNIELTNTMWRLNKERNQLVHNSEYNQIANRASFIHEYETSLKMLREMTQPQRSGSNNDGCSIM